MLKLLKRWYVWLGLVLLLGLAGSVALILANPSRITQANFDRIQQGMSLEEVEKLLGKDDGQPSSFMTNKIHPWDIHRWRDGPSVIVVVFRDGKTRIQIAKLATASETLQWYAKKGAEKIGVKWD